MTRGRLFSIGALLAAGLVVLAFALRFGPPIRFTLALVWPGITAWSGWFSPEPVREEIELEGLGHRLRADLYRPPSPRGGLTSPRGGLTSPRGGLTSPRGGLLLVHGLSRAGRRQPDLSRLAQLLSRHGDLVLVPQFEGLANFTLSGREVEDIRAALRHLRAMSGPVGILGFSFGAGPALVAASEVPGIRVVGSFGGYADLRHVITYITTGVHTFGGRRYVDRVEEYNRWKLLAMLLAFAESAPDRALLRSIVQRKLADPHEPTGWLEADLGEEGRAILALVLNRREEEVPGLLRHLSPPALQTLDRLSPVASIARLSGRLLIAHGAADVSIPFTESLRLADAARGRARMAILRTFHHTGPQPFWRSLREHVGDGWDLFRLIDDLLVTP